jgi:phosphoglycerate dehydrogenase-like enzyme
MSGIIRKRKFAFVKAADVIRKIKLQQDQFQVFVVGLNVFWEEPPNPNDKLLNLNNFLLTPHIAGWTADSVDAMSDKYN